MPATPHDAVQFSIPQPSPPDNPASPYSSILSSSYWHTIVSINIRNRSLLPKFFQVLVKHHPLPFFFFCLFPLLRVQEPTIKKKFRFLGWVMTPLTKALGPDDGVGMWRGTWQLISPQAKCRLGSDAYRRFLLRSFAWGPRDFSGMENPEIIVVLAANEKWTLINLWESLKKENP